MICPRKYKVVQRVLLLGGLFLWLFLVLVFLPLSERARELDTPLTVNWYKVQKTQLVEAGPNGINKTPLETRWRELNELAQRWQSFSNALTRRLALDKAATEKMRQPFLLVEYQNERQLKQEELQRVCREKKVELAPAALSGYPDYSADLEHPELLWAHLSIVHHAMLQAINCGVTQLISTSVRTPRPLETSEPLKSKFLELPVTLQLAGQTPAIARFLASLPARAEDPREGELPPVADGKPALFIERILIRRINPEKPDDIRLEIRFTGITALKH